MRINNDNKPTYDNEEKLKGISKQLSKLLSLPPYLVKHMIYTIYITMLHDVSCNAIDSDEKLKKVDIEIPHFGRLTVDSSNSDDIQVVGFELEEEFKSDLKKIVVSGDSELYEAIKDKFTERVKERYDNILG